MQVRRRRETDSLRREFSFKVKTVRAGSEVGRVRTVRFTSTSGDF